MFRLLRRLSPLSENEDPHQKMHRFDGCSKITDGINHDFPVHQKTWGYCGSE
jgi:hypothetical protein